MTPERRVNKIESWQEAPVSRSAERFELLCGEEDLSWEYWITVALIGRPVHGVLEVQFLIAADNPKNEQMIARVKREIDFFFFQLREPDPWLYAQHHCGTSSNALSDVHWTFYEPEPGAAQSTERIPEEVILEVGGDGGSITLLGRQNDAGEWAFQAATNESALCEMLLDEGLECESLTHSASVSTLPEAFALLDKYPWPSLYPMRVHPAFLTAVLRKVGEAGGQAEEARWRATLRIRSSHE